MIESILFSKTIDTESANKIIKKIENNLTTKFYKKGAKNICRIKEPVLVDREILRENLLKIQHAIDDGVQISFTFNGYDKYKSLCRITIRKIRSVLIILLQAAEDTIY